MRHGRERLAWDAAIAVVTVLVNSHLAKGQRPKEYHELHPFSDEVQREFEAARAARSAAATEEEIELGWAVMKAIAKHGRH